MTSNLNCDDQSMSELMAVMEQDTKAGIQQASKILVNYPDDARVHFLQGSLLIETGDLIGAHNALKRAVEIAPDFAIARFQLGFFQLTSGESNEALKTWARLDMLPDDHYLSLFVVGLRHLIRDEIADSIRCLEEGISVNQEILPLNNDMRLLVQEIRPLLKADGEEGGTDAQELDEAEEVSATSFILNQFKDQKRH